MGTRGEYVAWLSALSLAGLARPLGADEGAEEQAADAAREWLGLVDGGCCSASWERAAPVFRAAVTPERGTRRFTPSGRRSVGASLARSAPTGWSTPSLGRQGVLTSC